MLTEFYQWPVASGRPWLRANFATSVDGAVVGSDGLSASISNSTDKRAFAFLRATCDAVIVGASTAISEDYGPVQIRPEFASVHAGHHAPLVIVTASGKGIRPDQKFITQDGSDRTIIVTTQTAELPDDVTEQCEVLRLGQDDGVDLSALRDELTNRGYKRLLLEGGPRILAACLQAHILDEIAITTTPLLVGGVISDGQQDRDPGRLLHGGQPSPSTPLSLHRSTSAGNNLFSLWRPIYN